jgi:hypothetical protein
LTVGASDVGHVIEAGFAGWSAKPVLLETGSGILYARAIWVTV